MLFDESDTDALKLYIAKTLEPLSDADSDVLGDYVLALLKHDQPAEQVKELCKSQLEDFLGDSTNTFVDQIFGALESKSYAKRSAAGGSAKRTLNDDDSTPPKQRRLDSTSERRRDFFAENETNGNDPANATMNVLGQHPIGTNRGARTGGRGRGRRPPVCFDYQSKGYCARGDNCRYSHQLDMDFNLPTFENGFPMPPFPGPDFFPSPEAFGLPADFAFGEGAFRGNTRGRGRGRGRGNNQRGPRGPDHAEENWRGPSTDRTIKTLNVENIPDENLSEESIREYFSHFGTVESVVLDSPGRRCKVTFAEWDEAQAAYRSPAPIFNNRFVKVFWNKPRHPRPAPEQDEAMADTEDFQKQIEEKQKLHEEKMAKRLEHKNAMEALAQQKKALLDKQMEEQKTLMQKLAKGSTDAEGAKSDSNARTAALTAQLDALKAEASTLGLEVQDPSYESFRGRGRGRGRIFAPTRGSTRGRGWSGPSRPMSIDNRPKNVEVKGIPADKMEEFKQFMFTFGEYEKMDESQESKTIHFKDRRTAERFWMNASSDIPGLGKLELKWARSPAQNNPTDSQMGESTGGAQEDAHEDDGQSEGRWR